MGNQLARAVSLLLCMASVDAQAEGAVRVWFESAWTETQAGARLPAESDFRAPWAMTICRNDTEQAIIGLLNTGDAPVDVAVRLSSDLPAEKAGAELLAMGAIESRGEGPDWWKPGKTRVGLLNLFTQAQIASFGTSFPKHFVGVDAWKDFPTLHLAPGKPVRLWLRVTTTGTRPPRAGTYSLCFEAAGAGMPMRREITVRVLKVTLPREPVVESTTWGSVDDADSKRHHTTVNAGWRCILFEDIVVVNDVWAQWADPNQGLLRESREDPEGFRRKVKGWVEKLYRERLPQGFPKERFYIEICDEPNDGTAPTWVALAQAIRAADPDAKLIANPGANWQETKVTLDGTFRLLAPYVDLWVPFVEHLSNPEVMAFLKQSRKPVWFYDTPGLAYSRYEPAMNGFYRKAGWLALRHRLSGVGMWSASAPYGDPWDDFDKHPWIDWPDACVVFQSDAGPVTTRNWEAWRETLEDVAIYKMLALALKRGWLVRADRERARKWLAETPDRVLADNEKTQGAAVRQAIAEALSMLDRSWRESRRLEDAVLGSSSVRGRR